MANEILKRDDSHVPVIGGVTNDASLDVTQLRVDPVSKKLLIADGVAVSIDVSSSIGTDTLFDSDGDNSVQPLTLSAAGLYGIEASNPNSADAYIQFFDLATGSVNPGVTTPKLSFFVPAGDGTLDGAMDKMFPIPIKFSTAITYTCTTTATGGGDPTTGLIINFYTS